MFLFNHLVFDDFDHTPLILSLLKKCEKLRGIFESTERAVHDLSTGYARVDIVADIYRRIPKF